MSELSWDSYVIKQIDQADRLRDAARGKSLAEAEALMAERRTILSEVQDMLRTRMWSEPVKTLRPVHAKRVTPRRARGNSPEAAIIAQAVMPGMKLEATH